MSQRTKGGLDRKDYILYGGVALGIFLVALPVLFLFAAGGDFVDFGQAFGLTGLAEVDTSASVTNVAPTVSIAAEPDLTLSANGTTTITIVATVTDNNGCGDLTEDAVNLTLFNSNISDVNTVPAALTVSPNNRTRLDNLTCNSTAACSGGAGAGVQSFSCKLDLHHFATPTDSGSNHSQNFWNATVTAKDISGGVGADAEDFEINTLQSISVSAPIAFGGLALGANTGSTNQLVNVTNLGNERVDVDFDAYSTSGDGLGYAMNCSQGGTPVGNISVEFLQYSNQSFAWSDATNNAENGFNASDTAAFLNLDLQEGEDGNTTPYRPVYLGLGMPDTGVGGSCSGVIQVVATSDANGTKES